MEARLRRRAERNFEGLMKRLVSGVVLALFPIGPLTSLAAWSTSIPALWLLAGCWIAVVAAAVAALVEQVRRMGEFAPLGEAARLWLASVRRAISGKRRRRPSPLWGLLLAVILGSPILLAVRPPQIDLVGQYRPVSLLPAVLVYLGCVPLLSAAIRRTQMNLGGGTPVWLAAGLAVIPAFWVVLLEGRWQEARTFGAGPVVQETVTATIVGRCSRGVHRQPGGTFYCAGAATSHGAVRWATLLTREAWLVYRANGRACARVRLERAADGTFRLADGARRIGRGDLVACPSG